MKSIRDYLVKRENGSVDSEASIAKFREELANYVVKVEATNGKIAEAVKAVFDTHKGVRMNLPALTSFSLTQLGATPANHAELTEAVQAYVRANAKEGGIFEIQKGHGGGCCRVCDKKPAAQASA